MPWTFLLDREALAVLMGLSKRERNRLAEAFDRIAQFPEDADCEWNHRGFTYHEKACGFWLITYRLDGPVKHVLILNLTKGPTRPR